MDGRHRVGLAIKEERVKKAGKDCITIIEYINARLLKARISIKPNFVTLFVVAYAATEEAPEGLKARYYLASMPAREYVFDLTDLNARSGGRGEGCGEACRKVLGAYGRDVLNENGKLLLGFAEDNKLDLRNIFFHPQK